MKILRMSLVAISLWAGLGSAFADEVEVLIQPVIKNYPEIQLNVNIRDKESKKPIRKLKKKHVVITEDLQDVQIRSFKEIKNTWSGNKPVDIVFVFDDTGSMAEEIKGLIERTLEFADIISTSEFDYRLGLISYKDKIHKPYRVTGNAAEFKTWVSELRAVGGGDTPENALDAIFDASTQEFRNNAEVIFVLITDAPFHSANGVTSRSMKEIIELLAHKGIVFHAVAPNLDEYKSMTTELAGTFYDKDSGQFKRIIDQIAGGSANNYMITYKTNRPEHDFTWRAIELDLSKHIVDNGVSQYQAPSWVTSSSRHNGMQGVESKYSPHNAVDGHKYTEWMPSGQYCKEGDWVQLNFDKRQSVDQVKLIKSANNGILPEKVSIKINGDEKRYIDIEKGSDNAVLKLKSTQDVNSMRIEVESAGRYKCSIADIELYSGNPLLLIAPIKKSHEIKLTQKLASELNEKGEQAYHKKNYEQAIFYYLEAIKNNSTYAQAFSNLGLAYQRDKQLAKAIWANRKAIALARGKTRAVVSASSYYNIARIFEEQKKYEQALQNFYWAKSYRKHRAYDEGIARMKEHLKL